MNNILELKNIQKSYHTKEGEILAIKEINLNINKGEIISLVGPSGCGKSTLLSIICGLDKFDKGIINKDNNLKIGYMLQSDALLPFLTIYENAILGLKLQNNLTKDRLKYVDYLLKLYNLDEFKNNYPTSLSGGMKQRLALIRTLAINPDILLLDEPFSALDYQTRLALSNDLKDIINKENKTAIMVTHDIAEAISMSDKIIVITSRPGKVKKIIDVKLEKKGTPTENRKDKNFVKYYDMIWKELDHHV